MKLKYTLLLLLFCFTMKPTYAQEEGALGAISKIAEAEAKVEKPGNPTQQAEPTGPGSDPNVITMMAVITLVALLPYAIILLTSFLKIVIVLSLLRNALGVQQSPPNQALTGIALLMSIYVMFPTCVAMYDAGKEYITKEAPKELFSANSAAYIYNVVDKTKEPLKKFLIRNMTATHQRNFYQLAYRSMPQDFKKDLKMDDFIVLAPAYITSQLKGAFEVGVLIYLPFFVIDLVTSNILLAMGMMMLSPLTIALPLKLLLIVMTDGWSLVIQGLVQTYKQ
ncbi:type III secretion system export apparatus subunit SctR [Candidatus Neptunochlamydia vexilliferae]|uniref:Virulence protein YscR n=1 Tax=Candidatus Neptunichlamydia vexilliferae TaxID=1651774 RepID=A0ABS0B0H3_9BACT|nr:type III secretion system export apparatus subunit SctR [Candidatus Neptunochlamydia vexilliferae]MBF5059694.1 Virulence protein YscR [Candidatus Neptunochlamydia vexilliferae]